MSSAIRRRLEKLEAAAAAKDTDNRLEVRFHHASDGEISQADLDNPHLIIVEFVKAPPQPEPQPLLEPADIQIEFVKAPPARPSFDEMCAAMEAKERQEKEQQQQPNPAEDVDGQDHKESWSNFTSDWGLTGRRR